jgi:xanthine dehydrogenase accessory factor
MEGLGVLGEMTELTRRGEPFALATVVWRQSPSSSQPGARAIITAGGELHGWIGGACAEPVVIREAQQVIADGTARLLLLGTPEQFGAAVPDGMTVIPISCQSEGALEVYIEPVLPVPHLVIVGDSPMARTLASLAGALSWRTDLIRGPDFTPEAADGRSMIVVATQGHGDEDVLERAIAARPAYLGLVGSRRRGATVLGYLADRGVPRDQLDRVRVPAGLDLGRTTHQEIAVAILAELVQLRASGALAPEALASGGLASGGLASGGLASGGLASEALAGAHGRGPATDSARQAGPEGGRPAGRAALVVDPVCGMTVSADSSRPLRYEGTDYYFCCAGCRQAFEQDPDAYLKKETRC